MSSVIHFITGKGGVGKSTIAASMAMAYAKKGMKTLLVETSSQSYFKNTLGWDLNYKEKCIEKNFYACQYLYKDCLDEYLNHLLKFKVVAQAVLNNPVTQALINTAPALPSLAVLGKLTSGLRNMQLKLDYEHIIVDAPASGHFVAMIESSEGLMKAFKIGPIYNQAKEILSILKNSELVKFYIVLNSEQLTAVEGSELSGQIKDATNQKSTFFLNKFLISKPMVQSEVIDDFTDFLYVRLKIQENILIDFSKDNSIQTVPLMLRKKSEVELIKTLMKDMLC